MGAALVKSCVSPKTVVQKKFVPNETYQKLALTHLDNYLHITILSDELLFYEYMFIQILDSKI